jgi:hypothetical protein
MEADRRMKLDRIISIDDMRDAARRELPKIIFDFIEGGVDGEHCLATNEAWARSGSCRGISAMSEKSSSPLH